MPQLSVTGAAIEEGDGSYDIMTFTLALDGPAAADVLVPYRVTGGTAIREDDFTNWDSLVGVETIRAGQTQTTVRVRVNGDALAETDESVLLTVMEPANATLAGGGATLQTAGWILDDDSTGPTLGLFASDVVIREGDSGTSRAVFDIQLSRPAPGELSIPWTLRGGSAGAADFVAASGVARFAAGQRDAVVTADIRGDIVREMSESFRLDLQAPVSIGSVEGAEATILDDDIGSLSPTVRVEGESIAENDSSYGIATFVIRLDAPATTTVRVPYQVVGASAVREDDFTSWDSLRGEATISAGASQTTVRVRIEGDTAPETDEVVLLKLGAPVGAALPGGASTIEAPAFILDDDSAGPARLALHASNVSIAEGQSGAKTAVVDFTLSRPAPETITVPFTLTGDSGSIGSDVAAQSGTVTFLRGQNEASIAVELLGDLARETNETIRLGLALPASIASATIGAVTLDDDDSGLLQPVLVIDGESLAEGDSSYAIQYFTLRLSSPATTPLSIAYRVAAGSAVEGADYQSWDSLVGTARIAEGDTQTTIRVRVNGDVTGEVDESVVLEIDAPAGAQLGGGAPRQQAVGFILDDDSAGEARALRVLDAFVREGDASSTSGAFELRLSRAAESDIVIGYALSGLTATAGADFVAGSGSVVIRRGEDRAAIPFTVIGDRAVEGSETFRVNVTAPSSIASVSGGTATIVENDTAIDGAETGDLLTGTSAPDNVRGFGGDDRLFGLDGDDVLEGGAGNDTLSGGRGRDTVDGGSGFDMISYEEDAGGVVVDMRRGLHRGADGVEDVARDVEGAIGAAFDDRMFGREAATRLEGRDGADRLIGFAGNDTLLGGEGDDVLKPGAGNDSVDGGGGNDRILAGDGADTILGGAGDDVILPGRDADVVDAGAGNDIVRGFRGDERIAGGEGDDTLLGGLGDDTLVGGAGNDRLAGGPGRDTFLFDARFFGEDRIVDFRLGSDVIDFRGSGLRLADLDLTVRGGSTAISVAGAADEIVVGGVDLIGFETQAFLF